MITKSFKGKTRLVPNVSMQTWSVGGSTTVGVQWKKKDPYLNEVMFRCFVVFIISVFCKIRHFSCYWQDLEFVLWATCCLAPMCHSCTFLHCCVVQCILALICENGGSSRWLEVCASIVGDSIQSAATSVCSDPQAVIRDSSSGLLLSPAHLKGQCIKSN